MALGLPFYAALVAIVVLKSDRGRHLGLNSDNHEKMLTLASSLDADDNLGCPLNLGKLMARSGEFSPEPSRVLLSR